jgi:ABC-2 type transport system permease protein
MRDLCLLVRPRFLAFRNEFFRSDRRRRTRTFIIFFLGSAFWAALFFMSRRVLIYFQSVEMLGDLLAHYLLGMVLITLFSLLVLSHIITALSNLYLSKDLELCHSAPVLLEELFFSRAIYTVMDSSWMIIVFGIPIFMAYAHVYRATPHFYVTLFHLTLAMVLIAAGIGILVTMTLVYVFPAQKTKDLVMLLTLFIVVGLYLLFRFMRPERLVDPTAFFSITHYLDSLKGTQGPYFPTHWITETLWCELTQAPKGSWLYVGMTWSTAAALAVINVWVADALYFEGFSKAQESKRRRPGAKILDRLLGCLKRPLAKDLAALLSKDIRVFLRDNTQWSQLLLLAALVIVYLYNYSVLPLERSPVSFDFLQNELAFLNMGLAGFVLSAVSARFIFTAVSGEGEAYWIIRSSPLGLKRFLWGKYFLFLFPMLFLAEILIVCTNWLLQVTPFMMFLTAGTMILLVLGVVGLGVGLGAIHPQFGHQNLAQVSTGVGGFTYMVVSSFFVGVVTALEAGPVYILFLAEMHGTGVSSLQWALIGLSFLSVLSIGGFSIYKPMKMGLKALGDYE